MTDSRWQLEGSAAELYQRYLLPGITSKWARDLVHRAELGRSEEVLDIRSRKAVPSQNCFA